MDTKELILIMKALSDETRLKIFNMLKDKKLCGYHILDKVKVTQPTLSYHMKILCDCGLVVAQKDWKWIYYSQNVETLKAFTAEIKKLS
ncbi:MAG: winged helix-turn-helix transcriptional regulator [Clostridia bacterium]|nr:winged helix-turn-helix transcriptional regulator [Clostridia bacterium]